MRTTVTTQCSTAVSLFRGLYARVADGLGVDASYISRIARGERKSKVAEKALNREFNKALAVIRGSSFGKKRTMRTKRKVRQTQ
jgi:hypothetical protein